VQGSEFDEEGFEGLEKAGYVLEGRSRLAVTKAGRTGDRLLYALVRS
jgi:hypothetical protein